MAKVGEGDPRWIVSDRKDGANVNAWHWEERDLSRHTHDQLKKRFKGLVLVANTDGVKEIVIDEISEISGDVTVAQRKGKMMCYFELKMTLKWSGMCESSSNSSSNKNCCCNNNNNKEDEDEDNDENREKITGKMEIHEVDHDTFREDYDISVSCTDNSKEADKVENLVRSCGREVVRREIAKYFDELFTDYHIGQILKANTKMPPPPPLPTSPASPVCANIPVTSTTNTSCNNNCNNDNNGNNNNTLSCSNNTPQNKHEEGTSLSMRLRWRVPIEELYICFIDAQRASVYTRAPAKIDAVSNGGQFSFLNGVITGYFVQLQPNALITEQWRLSSWPVGVHSSVVMRFVKEEPGVTLLEFAQSGIPAGQLSSVQEGWRANFFDAIKMVFGYNVEYL